MRDPIALPCPGSRSPQHGSRVAALLEAAAAPAERPVPGEDRVLQMFRQEFSDLADVPQPGAMASELESDPTRRSMKNRTTTFVAASAIGAFTLLGGCYAAAATGTLPESASDAARAALAAVGLAGPAQQAGDKPADSSTTHTQSTTGAEHSSAAGSSADDATATVETQGSDPAANDHGQLVSTIARADYESGKERGEAVSSVASSKSTEHRQDDGAATSRETAGDTSEDAASEGRAKASEQSGGASDAGAGNADVARP